MILRKNFLTASGRGHRKVIQLYSGNLGIQGFWMCDIWCGSYRQKCIGQGYSAPCRRTYVVFCVWDIRRSLDQPLTLHRPPLHGLACSTTFSRRKIKIKILTITIGFLAPLVLGNVYACIRVPLAPRAWPPNKNLYNYNRVPSTAGPRKHVWKHMHSLGLGPLTSCCKIKISPK